MKWKEALCDFARTQGNNLYVEETISKESFDYLKRALQPFRGKWKGGKQQCFQLPIDASEVLNYLLNCEQMPAANPHSYHPTPDAIKKELFEFTMADPECWSHLNRPIRILEPSAGEGSLCDSIKEAFERAGVEYELTAVELDPINCITLKGKGYNPICVDFMKYQAEHDFDLVIMNPPFENINFIKHCRKAQQMLDEYGALVSIVPTQPLEKRKENSSVKKFALDVTLTLDDKCVFPAGTFPTAKTTETRIIQLRHDNIMKGYVNETIKEHFEHCTRLSYENDSQLIRKMQTIDLTLTRIEIMHEVKRLITPLFDMNDEANLYQPEEWKLEFLDKFVDGLMFDTNVEKIFEETPVSKQVDKAQCAKENKLLTPAFDAKEDASEDLLEQVHSSTVTTDTDSPPPRQPFAFSF